MAPDKVAVIGLGAVGSQALLECARRGLEVHGYEQFYPGHDGGAAGGGSRLYRNLLFEDPRYWPLSQLAADKWLQLETDTNELLRHRTGCLVLGPRDHSQMVAASAYASQFDVHATHYENGRARTEFPDFHFDLNDEALFDHDAAIIRPERSIRAAVNEAVRLGATIQTGTRVARVDTKGDAAVVATAGGGGTAFDTVILTMGPWLGPRGTIPAGAMVTKRPISAWYLTRASRPLQLKYGFIRTGPEHFYGVGALDDYEVKIGLSADRHEVEADPDSRSHVPSRTEVQPLDEVVRKYIPSLEPHPVRSQAFMEAYSADGHPLVGYVPGSGRLILATGFSGKGFKFAPAFGSLVTDLAEHGTSQQPTEMFAPQRKYEKSSKTTKGEPQ